VSIVLGVALLFAVWAGPSVDRKQTWPVAAQWFMWAVAIAALVFGILVIQKGWPQ
jgi:hypothetical protein